MWFTQDIPLSWDVLCDTGPLILVLSLCHRSKRQTRSREQRFKRPFTALLRSKQEQTTARAVVSGPLATSRRGKEIFSRLYALNEWLKRWTEDNNLGFTDSWNTSWERPHYHSWTPPKSPLIYVFISELQERNQ